MNLVKRSSYKFTGYLEKVFKVGFILISWGMMHTIQTSHLLIYI